MLNSRNHSKLIAGLVDKGVEFFVHQNEIKCVHDGKTFTYEEFPQWIFDKISDDMLSNPEALKSLAKWENLSQEDYMRQYIYCRYGGLDTEPDISVEGELSYAEYFDCGLRGTCNYEGKLCCTIKVANGHLTKSEIEILKRIDKSYKIIADELFVSTDTVSGHIQNIMKKTELNNKVELAIFATKKGFVK
ncbi:response regulator transcription factor [Pedobacter sp. Leaf170]|uniref:response regulator transcription factor n=1 Tax=Pedobacter sp. Leaf170 TaxID=2876558 RepID=UPI001E2F96B9|nr:LuxR C-terminal-related transcriptional regulator [Pedobacter sp. Leaf170]